MKVAIDVLRPKRPRLVIMSSFKHPVEVDMVTLCAKAVEMIHAHPGICMDKEDGVRRTQVLINRGVFKTDRLISHQFPLVEIQKAFETLENRPAGYLKGIVTR